MLRLKKIKSSEHQIQSAFFELLRVKYNFLEVFAFAIPNGGHRHISVAKKLKKEGVKAGVSDVFIAFPYGSKHGLWIEFKAGNNKMTEQQAAFSNRMLAVGYDFALCYSIDDAIIAIDRYLWGD